MNRFGSNILLFAILWAPVSGFFNSPWSELFLYLLPLLALLYLVLDRWKESGWIIIPPGFNAFLVFIGFGLMQLVPLPPPLVRLLSPEAWQIYQETAGVLQPDAWLPLTLAPKATLEFLFGLLSCWAAYTVAANFLKERDQLKKTASFMVFFGGGVAVGILIIWMVKVIIGILPGLTVSKFSIPSQPATIATTFMVMVCPLALALFLADRPTIRYGSLQERMRELFSTFFQKPYLIYGLSAIAIPLSFATYGGNLLVLVLAVTLFLVLMSLRERGRREVPYLVIYLFMVLMLWIFLPSTKAFREYRETEGVEQARIEMNLIVHKDILSDFILAGTGYGAFPAIGRRYGLELATEEVPGAAKQSFLQLVAQGGALGLAASVWFFIAFFSHTFRNWRNRRNRLAAYLYSAGLGGFFAFLASSLLSGTPGLIGFPVLAFFLLGLAVAAADPSEQTTHEEEPYRLLRPLTSFLTLASIAFVVFSFMGDRIGQKLFAAASDVVSETTEALESSRKLLNQASFFDPLNPRYQYLLGYRAMDQKKKEEALDHFAEGMRLDPLDGRALYGLGQSFFSQGDNDSAQKLLLAALRSNPTSREMQSAYVDQLLKNKQYAEALTLIRRFLQSSPEYTLFWIQNVDAYGIREPLRTRILPDRARSYHDYGIYLLQRGDVAQAQEFFRMSLTFAKQEKHPEKFIFISMAQFFEKQKSYDQTLDALLIASEKYPEDINFLMYAGRIYQEIGVSFKASEIYQKVLILDSANEEARQQLALLEEVL